MTDRLPVREATQPSLVRRGVRPMWGALLAVVVVGCGEETPSDPFLVHDTGAGGSSAEGGAPTDAGGAPSEPDPDLGAPCLDDEQCDDGVDCTDDECDDEVGRCRHAPDDARCHDEVYCDGDEVCEPDIGCVEGTPVPCSDNDTCTIDRCVESTHSCEYLARDMDGDGDPVWNCRDGRDCDDQNPRVSSLHEEVCSNGVDDDCDEEVDEDDCASPAYDRCERPLTIEESGSYVLSFVATSGDYGQSCVDAGDLLDVVVEISIPEGPPRDVDVVVEGNDLEPALALQTECGDSSSEISCSRPGVRDPELDQVGRVARLRAFGLAPGSYALLVFANAEGEAALNVAFEDASPPPENETCASAAALVPGEVTSALPYAAAVDHESACRASSGDLVYEFSLAEPSDVHWYASSLDAFGEPLISLRGEDCASLASELTCRAQGPQAHLFARALPAGKYYALVSSVGPAALNLLLEIEAASEPPATDDCTTAPEFPASGSATLELGEHTDSIAPGCLVGAVDAAFQLTIEEASDLLLLQNFSAVDQTAVGLTRDCAAPVALACASGAPSPSRLVAPAVEPGTYRVISESAQANSVRLAVFQRPATNPILVPFSDDCETAAVIPETGGHFYGNTATLGPNYEASCDSARSGPPGAADQMLRLSLSEPRRVIFDMRGSEYDTLLVVREGDTCPGAELASACSPNFSVADSYLDLQLPSGDYFVQIDGYAGDSGPWQLEVFTAPL
ncbi:MAG TPA: hypothetical protein VI197_18520 [Polyangiaceae bacterium]